MLPFLTVRGLFVTGTDTGVGKTTVSCALLRLLRGRGIRATPLKPLVSGREADGSFEDVVKLRLAAARPDLADDAIAPLRFDPPLAPAVIAEKTGRAADWPPLADRIAKLNAAGGSVLVEGAGGLLAPLDGPRFTNRELIADLRLPTLVVARAQLGTLNHTAMTLELLAAAGLSVAGVVVNGAEDPQTADDNRRWIEKMAGVRVLAVLPRGDAAQVDAALEMAMPALLPFFTA